jgi:hypothetical protein
MEISKYAAQNYFFFHQGEFLAFMKGNSNNYLIITTDFNSSNLPMQLRGPALNGT